MKKPPHKSRDNQAHLAHEIFFMHHGKEINRAWTKVAAAVDTIEQQIKQLQKLEKKYNKEVVSKVK